MAWFNILSVPVLPFLSLFQELFPRLPMHWMEPVGHHCAFTLRAKCWGMNWNKHLKCCNRYFYLDSSPLFRGESSVNIQHQFRVVTDLNFASWNTKHFLFFFCIKEMICDRSFLLLYHTKIFVLVIQLSYAEISYFIFPSALNCNVGDDCMPVCSPCAITESNLLHGHKHEC